MIRIVTLCLLLFTSTAWSSSILVLGDSLSAAYGMPSKDGWVALLQQRLHQQGYQYNVINASISGETTHGGLTRLTSALDRHQPALVVLELGANDGLRGAPLPLIRQNLGQLIQKSRDSGAEVLLFEMKLPPNYGPGYSQGFSAVYDTVAQQYQIAMVPFFIEPVVLKPELMLPDGLHPNAKAQPELLEQVWPYLQPLLKSPGESE